MSTPSLSHDAADAPVAVPRIVAIAGLAFVASWSFAVVGLRFDMSVSDVQWYWEDSLAWRVPFSTVHVPLYPLTIAALRGLTAGILPPLVYMWLIAGACHLVGVWAFTRSAVRVAGPAAGFWGGLAFAFWPLVGTSYAVYPTGDPMTLMFFVLGLDALDQEKFRRAGLALGFGLLANKAIWPVSLLIALAAAWSHRDEARRLVVPALLWVAPLAVYWLAGSIHSRSFLWPLSRYFQYGESRTAMPVFDGLFGHFFLGGTHAEIKGAVVWTLVLAALWLGGLTWRSPKALRDRARRLYALAIIASTVLGFLLLNNAAVWAAVRYSRLLAFPLVWYFPFTPRHRAIYQVVLVVLLATQAAYLYYMAEIFFKGR